MSKTKAFWKGRRVLVTGHTGFKGAWLLFWLRRLGAEARGLALEPATSPNLHALLYPEGDSGSVIGDIRDPAIVKRVVAEAAPEVVIHMAAQALVRPSYRDPLGTFATNLMGTLHVLEAARATSSVKAVVAITTDKVYENHEQGRPFVEDDRLGGHDPYSNSKACCELAVQCWRDSFSDAGLPPTATVRAGNVVGGGDWGEDRLIPDVMRALDNGGPVVLRYPNAVRPWQHVLEPLWGYLAVARRLLEAPEACPPALNFGPEADSFFTVAQVVERISAAFDGRPGWTRVSGEHLHEAGTLTLDPTLAARAMGWRPVLTMDDTIAWTAAWYADWRKGDDPVALTAVQIDRYQEQRECEATP